MKQKTEIIFEIEETVAFKSRRNFIAVCGECRALTEMVTTETAAALTGVGEREIYRLIENGRLHFIEAERVFVCRSSLPIRG
ncbi:MAG: hypothetical protein JSS81_04235 [Acidobacteria bacterium]|nr:hypothetical protein [Acidobacteriota bacterium]